MPFSSFYLEHVSIIDEFKIYFSFRLMHLIHRSEFYIYYEKIDYAFDRKIKSKNGNQSIISFSEPLK